MERGNLIIGTRKGQIASANGPRNNGRDKQIASAKRPRNDGWEFAMTELSCHCERNGVERGNLMKGTRKEQIASAKRPCNDGKKKQIASLRSQ